MLTRILFFVFTLISYFPNESFSNHLTANLQRSAQLGHSREKVVMSSPISVTAKALDTKKLGLQLQYKPDLKSRVVTGWGVLTVLFVLGNAIKRVLPIALQPFSQKDLSPLQWVTYGIFSLFMAYAEGYKAFQLKFSPLVVRRAIDLNERRNFLNTLFAGFYSMGLFGATKKRMITSWALSAGVFALVSIVKRLPYPWRSIIDGGVVVGLTYGSLSICWNYLRSFMGIIPDIDPCLGDHDETKKAT
jgi:hypothetical protein